MDKTVEIGDTEVTITETADGFEVTEADSGSAVAYVRENVRMASHENVLAIDDGPDNVQIVDTRNNIISGCTLHDIVTDDTLHLGRVHTVEGEITVKIRADGFEQ